MHRKTPSEALLLKQALKKSAYFHLALLLISFLYSAFFQSKSLESKAIWVELPRGLSEDIGTGVKEAKTLPRTTPQDKLRGEEKDGALPLAKKPDTETKLADKMSTPKKKPEKKQAPQKKLSAADQKMQAALARINKQLGERSKAPETAQVKESGEGFKYGTSDTPLKVSPDDPEYLKYQAMVRAKIIEQWIVPPRYTEESIAASARARLVVNIDHSGAITNTAWELRSDDSAFDASALRAVQRSSPLPVPPERLQWEAYHEGFLVEFDPKLK
ncbi:MAG: hypothetical protein COX62_02395 [Deltaproteobacteria bacterium CG_4_10_14_0_2_um_filter_43_8]|nr:MAG: hypothetical protein COV43_03900 [Deltaproteobacteria bacterium CG11_big_fil_rev_8_21_14_0_20_42_23]PJA21470.1 MAG: hypothetical protein COX62_02395 [Deltaproteobacteria bacterium CG_4_10_14_0_2_um_filter_43_8]PJC63379.1 MAG: hypothetical protein CO021_09870 [Deltaproteobacteria bacterium CG_4_9_14_0_2_um_filter_42_21]